MSKDIYKLYKITNNINSKVYIGLTTLSMRQRLYSHYKQGHALHHAIRKYGIDHFKIEHIASTYNREDMGKLEQQLIEQYNSMTPNGYNLTTGGEKAYAVSDESRTNMSKAQTGKKRTKEHISNMAITQAKNWIVITPDGKQLNVFNLKQYCQKQALTYERMLNVSKGIFKQHKGYKCSKVADLSQTCDNEKTQR